jgi:DDE superfamily endonuclease
MRSICHVKSGPSWRPEPKNIRHRIETLSALRLFCWPPKVYPTMSSPPGWTRPGKSSVNGESASSKSASPGWRKNPGAGGRPAFPPSVVVQVKALACELPHRCGLPLSRFTLPEIHREVIQQGIVATISGTTVWRWLSQDAIRPWRYRSWIFPRDPNFSEKAAPILDLYTGVWQGTPLLPTDYVLSADEKTSIQARSRKHHSLPTQAGVPMRIESEYHRRGAWVYLAAWDVHRAKVFGRCELENGIGPFDRLVADVMVQEPYRSATRVFWIVDNCSVHRGLKSVDRLKSQWPNLHLLHTPVHASWLNQIEIYFSIVQRKVLTPNDFESLSHLNDCLLGFQQRYQQIAKPFRWTFTRHDLAQLLSKAASCPKAEAA